MFPDGLAGESALTCSRDFPAGALFRRNKSARRLKPAARIFGTMTHNENQIPINCHVMNSTKHRSGIQALAPTRLKHAQSLLAALSLGAAFSPAFAGTFSTDFNGGLPPASNIYGTTTVDPTGGVNDSGVLKITVAQNNQNGSFIIDDFDGGQPVSSFTARFQALVGGGTASPAEGFSLNFAPDLPDGTWAQPQFGEGTGLSVLFQLFNPTGNPKLIVRHKGVQVVEKIFREFSTGTNFVDVEVKLDPDGSLDVVYNGNVVYTNLFAYTPIAGRFGFGGNTGSQNANMWIDDLSITTTTLDAPYVKSVVPPPVGASPVTPVRIELADFEFTQVDTNTVTMKFNGQDVVPIVTKEGDTTTILYDPPGLLPAGSVNLVQATYKDDTNPRTNHVQFEFVVAQVVIIPGNYATAPATVDTSKPGFKVRVVQARSDATLPPIRDRIEQHLAGTLIDPATSAPYLNEADLTNADSEGFFVDADIINYESSGTPAGNFSDISTPPFTDEPFPGIAADAPNKNNLSIEILAWLELKAGVYKMGVNSDDGFTLLVGPNSRDVFAIALGAFDDPAGRAAADTTFDVFVGQDGFYPFRLLYSQGTGGASLEWFTVDVATGQKIPINDLSNTKAVKAYREATRRPYVTSVKPAPGSLGVQSTSNIEIGITDGDTQLANNQVKLFLNGTEITPTFNKPAGSKTTTVAYDPAGTLLPTNVVRLVYGDNAAVPNVATNEFTFVLLPFLGNQSPRLQDSGPEGLLVLEAEHFDRSIARADHEWTLINDASALDFSGDGAVQTTNTGLNVNIDAARSAELDYKVKFVRTGRYYVWVRGFAPDIQPGGAGGNDSVNTGLDEVLLASSDRIFGFTTSYLWVNGTADGGLRATIDVTTIGEHHFSLFMREDGFIADKFLLTSDQNYVPNGMGPEESPREQNGSLVASVSGEIVLGTVVDLTAEGTADWAYWGRTSATSFDHKATGGSQISDITQIGSGPFIHNMPTGIIISWSDGTPEPSVTGNRNNVRTETVGDGFRFTAPADTASRTLKVYVGVWRGNGQLTARLSDASAAEYVDATPSDVVNGEFEHMYVYTLDYQAASAGQTLAVEYILTGGPGGGDASISAAILEGPPRIKMTDQFFGTWELSWPRAASAFVLQSSTVLPGSAQDWTEVPGVQTADDRYWVLVETDPAIGGLPQRYFRLVRPAAAGN